MARLTAERLRELLHYDPETGVFTWLVSPCNSVSVGAVAGSLRRYCDIGIDGCDYQAHRLAWFYMTGEWPKGDLDHVSVDKGDTRWRNLRLADDSKNNANKRIQINNTSGFKGITWSKRARKWRAQIRASRKCYHLGFFAQPWQAYAKYCLAARRHHGEFARLYDDEVMIIPRKKFEERVLRNLLIATQPVYEVAP